MEFTMMERLQYFDMLHGMAHKEVRTKRQAPVRSAWIPLSR